MEEGNYLLVRAGRTRKAVGEGTSMRLMVEEEGYSCLEVHSDLAEVLKCSTTQAEAGTSKHRAEGSSSHLVVGNS